MREAVSKADSTSIASDKLEVQKNIGMTLHCRICMNLRREPSLRVQRSNLNLLFNQIKDDKDCFPLRSSRFAMTAPGSTAKG